jgi:hypothetical protein
MPKKSVVQKEKRKRGRPPKKKKIFVEEAPIISVAHAVDEIKQELNAGAASEAKSEMDKILSQDAKPLNPLKRDAPESNCFVLCNGKPVKNVKELADIMEEIEDHVFNHHVTVDKNDFATWVKDIFQDAELAQKMAGANDKKHMQLVLYKHIVHKLW